MSERILIGVLCVLGGCHSAPQPCNGAVAPSCEIAAGKWVGNYSAPGLDTGRFALSVSADRCRIKGSLGTGQTYAALDGAVCEATGTGDIAFESRLSSGSGEITFEEATEFVSGEVRLTIASNNHGLPEGEYTVALLGRRTDQSGGVRPIEPCAERCDDGNVCTDDVCDENLECLNAANELDCDDGDACTVQDFCINEVCLSIVPLDCDDDNPCTTEVSCDSTNGCVREPNTDPCDDGDPCTSGDLCADGACDGTNVCICGDDTCVPGEDCVGCAADCPKIDVGPAIDQFCCGNGVQETAEGGGSICDGNY